MKEESQIVIYHSEDGHHDIEITLQGDTIWMTQSQIVDLFQSSKGNISEHIKHIYGSGELEESATVRKFRTVQQEGNRKVTRNRAHYSLDLIISVGYRVNSKRGTQFRIWANQVLRKYLIDGYAINEKQLAKKNQEIKTLKDGIHILNRSIGTSIEEQLSNEQLLRLYTNGLNLLDDYDHENLDKKGTTTTTTVYPDLEEYEALIQEMIKDFNSAVFGKEKDDSFRSAIAQITKGFDGDDFYPSIEEKAATLLYLIVKNHAFVDGNKRIAAACFLKFLQVNAILYNSKKDIIISNDTLASLTLFIASSKPEEMKTVKQLVISVLNRNK